MAAPTVELLRRPAPPSTPVRGSNAAGTPTGFDAGERVGLLTIGLSPLAGTYSRLGSADSDGAAQIGLNVSPFAYAVQDYVLVSISALFLPFVCILAASVAPAEVYSPKPLVMGSAAGRSRWEPGTERCTGTTASVCWC